jgi:hypothetical protein
MSGHDLRARGSKSVGNPADIPDLEPAPSRRSPPSAQVQTPPASTRNVALDPDVNLEEDWISGLGSGLLQLDVAERGEKTETAGGNNRRHWPTATRPETDNTSLEPAQLKSLCSWGEVPDRWLKMPLYAIAVYLGQRELARELDAISVELRQVEARRDSYLSELAQQSRDKLEGNARFASALQAVRTTEAALERSRGQLEQTETTSASELKAIDETLQINAAALAELQTSIKTAQVALDEAELGLQRQQARVQRLGIERRNLEQSQLDEQHKQEKLAALSEQAASLMPGVDTGRVAVQSRRTQRMQLEATAAQKQSEIDNLRSRRAAVERELGAHLDSAGAAVANAHCARTAALADLGRGILLAQGGVPVSDAQLTELVRFDDAVAALCHREHLYRGALVNYDRAAVKRGLQLSALVLLLLVTWCVWRAFG